MNTPPIPPVPPIPGAPLKDTSTLTAGDVVQIAVKLQDKLTGQDFWWKRFAVVTHIPNRRWGSQDQFNALTLKMHPVFATEPGKASDLRTIDLEDERQVVTKLEPDRWPQGVIAMRMKALALGWVKIGEESP